MANTEVVVPILFRHAPGDYEQAGTGFIVAAMGRHALVVTAGHVLEAICHRTRKPVARTLFCDGSEDKKFVIASDEHEIVIVIQNANATFYAEAFDSWGSKAHDIALLNVNIPEGLGSLINKQFAINPGGPKLGEEVHVFGYFEGQDTSSEIIPPGFDGILKHLMGDLPRQFIAKISSQKGRVVKDYPDGTGLVRSPCFVVDVPFNSGMSGGVVFQVIGGRLVACGLMSNDEGQSSADLTGTGGHAVVAKLAPLFIMELGIEGRPPFTYTNPSLPETTINTLRDLSDLGVIEVVMQA
ncbi:hypothetical protein GALL_472530 [mine drainage metagenome]|uniref:Trypsin-like peptidase domain-containing protein n=1 Tax=mine drainage metagenome TaxID=410659 RepID=A0A1J5PU60_9ZZZZ